MIVTNVKPVFPLKNCVLVSTNVAYRYTPTARVSIVASYHRQLRIPISSGMVIASTIIGWLDEGWQQLSRQDSLLQKTSMLLGEPDSALYRG